MEISELIGFFTKLDTHITDLIEYFGIGAYLILFFIIFLETGAVILAILPGDSLLVGAGAFASTDDLNVVALLVGFYVATLLGDMLNFKIGKYLGGQYHRSRFEDRSLFKFINEGRLYCIASIFLCCPI